MSRIRATVRAGRDRMRQAILDMLPLNLAGRRVLDAGCGTGALALALARTRRAGSRHRPLPDAGRSGAYPSCRARVRRGRRVPHWRHDGSCAWAVRPCRRDGLSDPLRVRRHRAGALCPRRSNASLHGVHFRAAHARVGADAYDRPHISRSDRAPSIAPVAEMQLRMRMAAEAKLHRWCVGRDARIAHGFYTSHAMELVAT